MTLVVYDKAQASASTHFWNISSDAGLVLVHHCAVLNRYINGWMMREILVPLPMDGTAFCLLLAIVTAVLGPQEKNYRSFLFAAFCLILGKKSLNSVAQVCLELGTILSPLFPKC